MEMIDVCPKPRIWNEIYQKLYRFWELQNERGFPPPIPLVLSGWAYSNDVEKSTRWKETLSWANTMGCPHLIRKLDEADYYKVESLTDYVVGPLGGPMYLPWDYTSKIRPSAEELEDALAKLIVNWANIIGKNFYSVTEPIGFTGDKRRRLLVLVTTTENPPWGTWFSLAHGEKRRSFTDFRKKINETINPLMVDHVDFIINER